MLCCPVCRQALHTESRKAACDNGHCFDFAKEGYLNLLRTSKSGDKMGDDKQSARSRRDFLNQGYYAPLKDFLVAYFRHAEGTLLDICCGEGYYTSALGKETPLRVFGFDISKEMVRLAGKRGFGTYFVANMADIPVMDASFDYAIHLFAPFQEQSFARVLKPGGKLLTVIPGSRHLFGLKEVLYDTPYLNDEKLPETEQLKLVATERVDSRITLRTPEDIDAVFRMTPYYFHTSQKDKEKLLGRTTLETEISYVIGIYEKA